MNAAVHVRHVDVAAAGSWSMDGSQLTWRPGGEHGWTRTQVFDPFPAYAHEFGVVEARAETGR